jgi:hypothetical protein
MHDLKKSIQRLCKMPETETKHNLKAAERQPLLFCWPKGGMLHKSTPFADCLDGRLEIQPRLQEGGELFDLLDGGREIVVAERDWYPLAVCWFELEP